MKKGFMIAVFILLFGTGCLTSPMPRQSSAQPPPEGGVFPEIALPVPEDVEARKYLGVDGGETFRISDVDAQVVIVEIFSMYCPYCQQEAPRVNELYDLISQRGLKDKVKIFGIGASNTLYEVNTFKEKYHIPFPLLPDPELTLHRDLGNVRTPYFIVVDLKNGSRKVVYSKLSSFGDPKDFLDLIVKETGLSS